MTLRRETPSFAFVPLPSGKQLSGPGSGFKMGPGGLGQRGGLTESVGQDYPPVSNAWCRTRARCNLFTVQIGLYMKTGFGGAVQSSFGLASDASVTKRQLDRTERPIP